MRMLRFASAMYTCHASAFGAGNRALRMAVGALPPLTPGLLCRLHTHRRTYSELRSFACTSLHPGVAKATSTCTCGISPSATMAASTSSGASFVVSSFARASSSSRSIRSFSVRTFAFCSCLIVSSVTWGSCSSGLRSLPLPPPSNLRLEMGTPRTMLWDASRHERAGRSTPRPVCGCGDMANLTISSSSSGAAFTMNSASSCRISGILLPLR
mmetsp:Transcript_858/g.3345  ORF Transcript_858/g.3345 Transcript_858/m.3345 type:complete len:213 (+) Transcript_858:544-1182(+)